MSGSHDGIRGGGGESSGAEVGNKGIQKQTGQQQSVSTTAMSEWGCWMCTHGHVTLVLLNLLVSLAHSVHILPQPAGLSINKSIIPDPDPITLDCLLRSQGN